MHTAQNYKLSKTKQHKQVTSVANRVVEQCGW